MPTCRVCHCPRFDPAEDVIASAGYRDYQFLIVILGDDGIYRHAEIQVRCQGSSLQAASGAVCAGGWAAARDLQAACAP